MNLGPLYHWSPRDRRGSILRLGLVPGKRNFKGPIYHGTPDNVNDRNEDLGAGEFLRPSVCFATSPLTAWDYSHGCWKSVGTFDLWQVVLVDADEVHINPQWGARIIEVRVHNRIPKSRLAWVGERTVPAKVGATKVEP